jgi:hypothetical protein
MDPASGIGLFFEGASLVSAVLRHAKSFKKAPKTVQLLIDELRLLEGVLHSANEAFDTTHAEDSSVHAIHEVLAPSISQLKTLHRELTTHTFQENDGRARKLLKRGKTMVRQERLQDTAKRIRETLPLISLALQSFIASKL